MLRKLKDEAVAWTITQFFRSKLERYGEVRALNFDSSSKRLTAQLLLRGDTDPLNLALLDYNLKEEGSDLILTYASFETSREWVTQLVRDLIPDNRIKLPPQARRYAGLLKMLF